MLAIRSVVFFVVMLMLVVIFAVPVMLTAPFNRAFAYRFAAGFGHCTIFALKAICGLDHRMEGQENIPTESSVVYLKHESAWETIVELIIFPRQAWVFKKELTWVPFFGWALRALSPIAIDRSAGRSALRQVVEQGTARLREGVWVMIFPEGTRMAPGETRRYGLSGAVLAKEANVLLVPVAHNAGDFWRRRGFHKKPGTIRLCIGPPIDPTDLTPEEINAAAKSWIDQKMSELRPE